MLTTPSQANILLEVAVVDTSKEADNETIGMIQTGNGIL